MLNTLIKLIFYFFQEKVFNLSLSKELFGCIAEVVRLALVVMNFFVLREFEFI